MSAASLLEGLDEVVGKHRVEPLRHRVGGGDDDAAVAGQALDERKARRRGVDDHDAAGEPGDELGPLRRLQIGADEVELGVDAIEGAVADEHDEEQVVARHGAADGREVLPDVGGGGRGSTRRSCR